DSTVARSHALLSPLRATIATPASTYVLYDLIPDQFPIHTSFSGKVTYDNKSIGNLLILPLSQLFMIFTFLIVNYVIKHSKQQISAENPARSKKQIVFYRKRWSLYLLISAYLITALFTFLQLTFIYPTLLAYEDILIYSVIGFVLLGAIVLSITTGQGGSRIKIADESRSTSIDRDEDVYWK